MKGFLERHVWHNLPLKLIALGAAVLLWSAIAREPLVEVAYTVPVEFHQVPRNLEITSEEIPQALVRLRGPERRLRRVTASEIHTVVDLSGAASGERTYDLTPDHVHVPFGIEVVQIIPSQLRISFDRRMTREVPVRPRVVGKFAGGFGILQIIPEPSKILVVGPERRVKAVTAAMTDPIDASGVVGSATFTTNAYVADPLVREAKAELIRVTVVTGNVQSK